jgi:hypothetical protein
MGSFPCDVFIVRLIYGENVKDQGSDGEGGWSEPLLSALVLLIALRDCIIVLIQLPSHDRWRELPR